LHNKPLGCCASEVYASGLACEEEGGIKYEIPEDNTTVWKYVEAA